VHVEVLGKQRQRGVPAEYTGDVREPTVERVDDRLERV